MFFIFQNNFQQADAERALRSLHYIFRDAWEGEGLRVYVVSGAPSDGSSSNDYAVCLPVDSWFDDECLECSLPAACEKKDKPFYDETRKYFQNLKTCKKQTWKDVWHEFFRREKECLEFSHSENTATEE